VVQSQPPPVLLAVDHHDAAGPDQALLVYGHLPPVRIRLRPWFRSRRLVSLAMAVDAAVPHPAMAVDDLATVEVLRPTDEGEAAA
jgi:hypothetical protein